MDGSASISLEELASGWPEWSEDDRIDFTQNCSWLADHPDLLEILRYIVQNGDVVEWAGIAQSIARHLPADEAFETLESVLARTPSGMGPRSNILQAVALMKHPRSVEVIRNSLDALLASEDVWNDDPFLNWTAYEATCAIEFLLRLGEAPAKYEPVVRRLAAHSCRGNVESVRRTLGSIYELD